MNISPNRFINLIPLQLILFIFFFGLLSLFINTNNIKAFSLQQLSIESIVERGHVYLEGSQTPGFQPVAAPWADAFSYKGHIYSNKQPGLAFIGSIVYFVLYKLGINYKKDAVLTGGLVTLFTSALMTSIMMASKMQ